MGAEEKNELVLAYQTPEPLLGMLKQVLRTNGFAMKAVTDCSAPIGAAAGVLPAVAGRTEGLPPAAPMLILCGLTEARLDLLLDSLRAAGLRFPFKAVLTETNQYWTPGELYAHLSAEREAILRRMRQDPGR